LQTGACRRSNINFPETAGCAIFGDYSHLNPHTVPAKISYLLLVLGLFTASTVFSQNIRKVKIEELGSYIQKSERPLVVNFWATWCAPCVAELPYFQEEVKKQASNNVELVLVSLDFADAYPAKLSAFIKKNKYEASFFWLDETNADHFCPVIDKSWSGSIRLPQVL
jgi:thiol-disulfide isomerase/thioredoxin